MLQLSLVEITIFIAPQISCEEILHFTVFSPPFNNRSWLFSQGKNKGCDNIVKIIEGLDAQNRKTPSPPPEDTRRNKIAERRGDYPRSTRGIYDRAMGGRSRKSAIRAFCIMCMGFQPRYVSGCTDPACPLYKYRMKD